MVFPYLKGLVIIKCGFFYLPVWIYCVFNICGDYIFIYGIEVTREVVGGGRGPIVIIVEAIQCKVD